MTTEATEESLAQSDNLPEVAQESSAPTTRAHNKTLAARSPRKKRKVFRSVATLGAVGALVATTALSAFANLSTPDANDAKTLQQIANDGAQTLVVASAAEGNELKRDAYKATTEDEIAKKKAEEAAAARAAAAKARASSRTTARGSVASYKMDLSVTAPGTGEVRMPLNSYRAGDGVGYRPGHYSSFHAGLDMLTAGGSPIFAATGGKVRKAGWCGGYGNCVVIETVLNGTSVKTLYGHQRALAVRVGQTVSPGQVIGQVGSTGFSTANHLHFEVYLNGQVVYDPVGWVRANS